MLQKKMILLMVAFVTVSFFCSAQSYEINRLRKQISMHPQQDTFRVNRLTEICNTYPSLSVKEIGNFADEALLISRKLGYGLGEGYALIGKARAAYIPGNKEEGANLLMQADAIAKKTGDQVLQLWVLIRLASCYMDYDNKRGLNYALKAEALAQQVNNKALLSKSQHFASSCYSGLGDYGKSMEYAMNALKAAEESNCLECEAMAWARIAATYTFIGDYDKSNHYYQRLYGAYKELGYDQANNAEILNNIGENYRLMGKYPEALQQYKQALTMNSTLFFREACEANIADVYVRIDSLQPAFQYAFSSLAVAKQLNDKYLEAWIDGLLSRTYLKSKMPDSALYYATHGLALSEKTGAVEFMRDNTLALANAYAFKNDFKNAYHYHTLYISYRDSILNNEITSKTAVLENTYEMEKKEGQIKLLSQQKKAQQNLLIAVSAVLLLIFVCAIILLRSNRLKQRTNIKIEKAYAELQTAQAHLVQSEKMASLGELTAGIAHEIQNPLNFVNNFSELNKEMLEELKAERLKPRAAQDDKLKDELIKDIMDNSEKINHHGKRADAIVKGMLQHSRTSSGIKEPTDINKLADEYLRLAYHGLRAKDKSFTTEIRTDYDETIVQINVVPQDLGRVLLNIINNAFYAVNEKLQAEGSPYVPTVTVVTKKLNDKVEIKISDNGNGIPQNIIDKIFQPFFTTKPTGSGTGLGLSLAYDIIKAHGGEIKVNTREREGSRFIITLPV